MLGVDEKNLAGTIKAEVGIECESNDLVHEIVRAIRLHITKLVKPLDNGNMEKAQLGLGHSYSRAKVKFNVNRSDTMVTQAINMLDLLDKDINTFSMRVRQVQPVHLYLLFFHSSCSEWYSWHFPELIKIVSDNYTFTRLAKFIQDKSKLSEEHLSELEAICDDASKAKRILDAARASMGTDISPIDLLNIETFATRVIALMDYRKELQTYLHEKMNCIAPNLSALIGDVVGARLISHAGSLTNLSKYPASTVQILGAEKALFRQVDPSMDG
jgi:nucleolar protein 56